MKFLAESGLTPSEARDFSTYPGFVDLDLHAMASWVFLKEKLGFSAHEVAKVFIHICRFEQACACIN